jgi:hypothetical protein
MEGFHGLGMLLITQVRKRALVVLSGVHVEDVERQDE